MLPSNLPDVATLQAEVERYGREVGDEPPCYQLHLRALTPVFRETVRVEPSPLLIGRTLYERLWVVINRAIRRVARYGVEPAVRRQNDLNAAVQHALDRLIAFDDALHAEIVRLRAEERHGRG